MRDCIEYHGSAEAIHNESSLGISGPSDELDSVDLNNEERTEFYTFSRYRELRKKQPLYFQGDQDDTLYLMISGAVKLTKITMESREHIVDIIGRNAMFGRIPDLEQMGDDSAVVIEDGFVHVLDREGFERLSQKIPLLAAKIKKVMGFRRNRIECRLIDLLTCTVEQKLAKTFLRLLDDFGVPKEGGFLLKVGLTHLDYADMIASTRETVTLKLNKFRKERLIDYEGRHIIIRSIREMRGFAKRSPVSEERH